MLVPRQIILFIRFLLNDFKSFHPLFKVLFIFPSQYLYAIGFPSIFSLRRSLPPILGWIPDQPDSIDEFLDLSKQTNTGLLPSMACRSRQLILLLRFQKAFLDYNSVAGLKIGLLPLRSPLLR